MPSEWRETTLGRIALGKNGLVDGPFGSNLPASLYCADGVPVVRGSNLTVGGRRFVDDEFVFVSAETAERLSRSICVPDDIVFTKKGTLGQTGIVPRGHRHPKFLISSNQMKLSVSREQADPLFVYYSVTAPAARDKLIRDAEATGVPKTNVAYLRQFSIMLPPINEQRAIAHVLGALDDKIELNRKMNETLEQTARAIFRSWFMDFEPFRDKGMVESELGRIPKGWKVERIDEALELAYGKALKGEVRKSGDVPVYGSNGQVGWHDEPLVKGPGIVVGRKGNPGTVTWVPTDFFPIDTTFFVVPKGDCRSLFYLFHALRSQRLESLGADSAVPGLNRNIAYMNNMLLPSRYALERFDVLASPMASSVSANDSQSRTLAAIRDALLPKLMSGEVRAGSLNEF